MPDRISLPSSVKSIVVSRLDALGDAILGTMLLEGLHRRWPDAEISLVVRPGSGCIEQILPDWAAVRVLPFDPRLPVAGREAEIAAQFGEFAGGIRADLFVAAEYNRTWAGEILAAVIGAPVIGFDGPSGLNFTHNALLAALKIPIREPWTEIHIESAARECRKYATLIDALGLNSSESRPSIVIRDADRTAAAEIWAKLELDPSSAVVFFPGSGEGLIRSLSVDLLNHLANRIAAHRSLVLLGAESDCDVLNRFAEFGEPGGFRRIVVNGQSLGLTAAILESAAAYVGMDTGPMHLAAVLDRPTLGLFGGGHGAERFLPVGRRAAAVRMKISCYGCDWHCPFDQRLCLKEMPQAAVCAAVDSFLVDPPDHADVFQPRIYEIAAPEQLRLPTLAPVMRQHQQFLKINHDVTAHHDYLKNVIAHQQTTIEQLAVLANDVARQNHERGLEIARLLGYFAELTLQNQARDRSIQSQADALAEMTRHNDARDQAIERQSQTLAEMSCQNKARDGAIEHGNKMLAELSEQNGRRDAAIAHLNQIIAEMSAHNAARDQAISHINAILAEMTRQNQQRDSAISRLS